MTGSSPSWPAPEAPLGAQLRLLTSIPGLGLVTAATLLASLPIERLTGSRQVAAYVSLCPQERSSGSSIRGRARTGPLGPAHLRKALYMPALVAMRANPTLRAFAERLRAAGKRPKVVVVAVMRKLLLLAWAILRSGQPFCPNPSRQSVPTSSRAVSRLPRAGASGRLDRAGAALAAGHGTTRHGA